MKIMQAFRFEAAHRLPRVAETHSCYRLHGHSYRVELQLEGAIDPESGFLVDFFEIEAAFGPLLKQFDHHYLNEIAGLENPTAENIAIWIWGQVKDALPSLAAVRVYETPDCWAEYRWGLSPALVFSRPLEMSLLTFFFMLRAFHQTVMRLSMMGRFRKTGFGSWLGHTYCLPVFWRSDSQPHSACRRDFPGSGRA